MAANIVDVKNSQLDPNDSEKAGGVHTDDAASPENTIVKGLDDDYEDFTLEEQRKIIHRVDRRLIAMTGIMYCISLMDRTNLSAAAIARMIVDLRLIQTRYNIIALVFFMTYVLFQPPATVLCRKIGPRPFLRFITLAWGVVMIGFGFPTHWHSMIGLRLLLGIFEAGFFPGCVFLISTWYVRYDLQKRYSVFYLIGCVASACSGIPAFGLMQWERLAGYNGWSWIFIIEGIITCLVGIGGYFALVNLPDRAAKTAWGFLSEKECNFIMRRVARDRGDTEVEPFNLKQWASAGLDSKIWGFALIFFSKSAPKPIIMLEPWRTLADKYHPRGPAFCFNSVLALIGLHIMGFHSSTGVRYFGVFLITAGAKANIPAAMAYQANNIRGQWKRTFCSASLVGLGTIGGIAGSLVFRSQDAPLYRPGCYAAIACNLIICVLCVNTLYFRRCNKKADRGEMILQGLLNFRYTY